MPRQGSTGWGLETHFAESFISCRLPLPEQGESAFQAANNDAKCSCICTCCFPFISELHYPLAAVELLLPADSLCWEAATLLSVGV